MQVKLTCDCEGPNPEFVPEPRSARKRKRFLPTLRKPVPRTITIPAGTVIDHPDAWMLCIPERIPIVSGKRFTGRFSSGPCRAEPVDDEAREAVIRQAPDVARQIGLLEEEEDGSAESSDSSPAKAKAKARAK